MKKQFVIINKGKGVLKITPSNLNEVEQPLTEIEALYDYVNTQDGEVLLNSKAYTDSQITIVDTAITLLGNSISTVNQDLTTKIEQLDETVDTRIALLDETVDTKLGILDSSVDTKLSLLDDAVDVKLTSLNENLVTKIDDVVYDITEISLPLKENKSEKGGANGYTPLNAFAKISLEYLNVVNNLINGGTDALLTAEQGKQLQLQVSSIQSILFSDNINLDTVQEIVDALENVQSNINNILVNDLTTGGTTKALTAEMGKVLKTTIDSIYQPDVLITSVAPARVGNTFTYPAGQYTYLINKVLRTLLANYIVTIDAATATNLKRVDLIQAKADGTFSKKIGIENAIIAIRPEPDANCVPISFINVFGNTIEQPTPITKELSIQDYNGVEKFRITDYLRFKGVSFDADAKALVTEPLMPLAAFLDVVNGNDSTASIENSRKSFKTMSALINALPVHTGETFTIYIDAGIIPITRKMPTRNLTFVANKATTLDFTNCMEDDGVTNAMTVLKNVSSWSTRVWTFNNSNISIICDYVGVKYFGVITDNSLIALKGTIAVLNWKSKSEVSFKGFVIEAGTDLKINTCFNSTQDTVLFSGASTDNTIHIVNYNIVSDRLLNYRGNLIIDNIIKIGLTIFNANLGYSITKKIGNVQFDDGTLIIGATDICQFNGKITGTCIVDLLNIKIIEGTLTSETYCTDQYLNSNILYRNFTGKLTNLLVVGTGKVTFENCTINVKNNLIRKYSSGAGNSGSGASIISDIVTFRGSNTIIQDSTTGDPLFVSNVNAFSPRILIKEYGSTKTNAKYFGDYVDIITLASTFKEKLNEIVIRSKTDLINRVLSPTLTYVIDGTITLLSGEYIEVPSGGLTISGYGFDVSKITKSIVGQSIFSSPVGGSGNFVTNNMEYNSGLGSVFNLTDSDGSHAIELNDINFQSCASLGKLTHYRQFTGTTCGIYGCTDGIQLSGVWNGFKLTNSNCFGFGNAGTLFKKDVDTAFSNRFYLELNADFQTGAKLADFQASNFLLNELFQINASILKYNGTINDNNATSVIPNIKANDVKCLWRSNVGLPDTATEKYVENNTVTGTYEINWLKDTYYLTLTGNTTITESNLPASGKNTEELKIYLDGAFTPTFPSAWNINKVGTFKPGEMNQITLKYIKTGVYFMKIDNSLTVYPAPNVSGVAPNSILPDATSAFTIYGSFFTPATIVSIASHTVNSVTFINQGELLLSVTTANIEGDFALTVSNGTSISYTNKVSVYLGIVFTPIASDWEAPTGSLNVSEGSSARVVIYEVNGTNRLSRQIDYTKNNSIRFNLKKTPLGYTANNEVLIKHISLIRASDNTNVLAFSIRREPGYNEVGVFQMKNNQNWDYFYGKTGVSSENAFDLLSTDVFEFRIISKKLYMYINGFIRYTYAEDMTENLKFRVETKTFDIENIKFIELAT